MPTSRPKPTEIAIEAKRRYFPYILKHYPQWRPASFIYHGSERSNHETTKCSPNQKLLHVVIDADPVDVALDWSEVQANSGGPEPQGHRPNSFLGIPVVNMANERRPGGDWESGLMAPEENMCRRSNLVQCLESANGQTQLSRMTFSMPLKGGLYSPHVVFRSGPDAGYAPWSTFKTLPVISVAPIRRPKLDASEQEYSFVQEKEVMKEKIRTVLRIAMKWNHRHLCAGSFGAGPGFRNPPKQLARMWKDILYTEPEFEGFFSSIVFAIEKTTYGAALEPVYDVFKQEFDPSSVCKTSYR